jgi:hypothetical protein
MKKQLAVASGNNAGNVKVEVQDGERGERQGLMAW